MMHFNISAAVNRGRYDKQKDCRLSLLTKKKNMFFENIDTKIMSDNQTFRESMKPLLSLTAETLKM